MASGTYTPKWSKFPTCLQVLNLMVILGFMFNYMLRVNLTIAVVAMVAKNTTQFVTPLELARINGSAGQVTVVDHPDASSTATFSRNRNDQMFNWNEAQKNDLLGSFFWGYILTEVPGGRLAELIGGKRVIGSGMFFASLLTLLTPLACRLNYQAALIVRATLGFCLGATWPATLPLAANWIPPLKRSRFMSHMMASSLGAALTMPFCGYLIATFGWASVFYSTGVIGFLWSLTWWYTVYDSPAQHPRISREERDSIESEMLFSGGRLRGRPPATVPWFSILKSGPVWAIIVTHVCSVFCYFTVVNQLPTYMDRVLKFNIKENGLLSSLPYLGKYIMAVIAGYTADRILQSGQLSLTSTRKLFTTFAVATPGCLMAVQALFGDNAPTSVAVFTMSLFVNGAVSAGYLANGLDIAPNFSGTIFGIANTLSSLGGWLSTKIVTIVTASSEGQEFEQWQTIFWILVGMYTVGATVYLFFGSGELQPWNGLERNGFNSQNGVDAGRISMDLRGARELLPLKENDGGTTKEFVA